MTHERIDRIASWVRDVTRALSELRSHDAHPALDVEWLLLRCNDTLGYTDQLRESSAEQLSRDLAEFDQNFPGMLPRHLLACPS